MTIPKSTTAHQAADKRYYKRYNFESVPMEDYEVRDIMNRLKYPLLVPEFSFQQVSHAPMENIYLLLLKIRNEGAIRAREIKVVIGLPKPCCHDVHGYTQRLVKRDNPPPFDEYFEHILETSKVVHVNDEWLVSEMSGCMLYYKTSLTLDTMFKNNPTPAPFLYWRIYADDAPPQQGEVPYSRLTNF